MTLDGHHTPGYSPPSRPQALPGPPPSQEAILVHSAKQPPRRRFRESPWSIFYPRGGSLILYYPACSGGPESGESALMFHFRNASVSPILSLSRARRPRAQGAYRDAPQWTAHRRSAAADTCVASAAAPHDAAQCAAGPAAAASGPLARAARSAAQR